MGRQGGLHQSSGDWPRHLAARAATKHNAQYREVAPAQDRCSARTASCVAIMMKIDVGHGGYPARTSETRYGKFTTLRVLQTCLSSCNSVSSTTPRIRFKTLSHTGTKHRSCPPRFLRQRQQKCFPQFRHWIRSLWKGLRQLPWERWELGV
jgi:hypothetical protein